MGFFCSFGVKSMFDFLTRLFGEVPDNHQTRKLKREHKKQQQKTTREEKIQASLEQRVQEEKVNLNRQVELIEESKDLSLREKQIKAENKAIKAGMPAFMAAVSQRRKDALEAAKNEVNNANPVVDPDFTKDFFDLG